MAGRRKKSADYARKTYSDRRLSGVCTYCGRAPAREGHTTCAKCGPILAAHSRKWRREHPERAAKHVRSGNRRVRLEALATLGGRCACCGETTPQFLTFDHVDNNGSEHRKSVPTGPALYYRIRDNRLDGVRIQVLCWNCNAAKAYYGKCPHKS